MNFNLFYYHQIQPNTFEEMIPWEKDIYVDMLVSKVQEENEKKKLEQSARRATAKRNGR